MKSDLAAVVWQPVGVAGLEPAAEVAVRSHKSALVIAGPGAGKTELLAQRACFLLQTGACPDPHRILAISFKRDAASNLRDRVARRCGPDLARRFDSYTFDSFSKSLVDRFLLGLPELLRPSQDYLIVTDLGERNVRDCVLSIPSSGSQLSDAQRHGVNGGALWESFVSRPLPADGKWQNLSNEDIAAEDLWRFMILGNKTSVVAFPMLGRMAELLLRTNPRILAALRMSYRYVFLDEFQDTTRIQYALVRTAFAGSGAVLTAVGDKKQRIMGWAGAMQKAFESYAKDFGAVTLTLAHNYRSSPELVRVQSIVAQALDALSLPAMSMDKGAQPSECCVLLFKDDTKEATQLAIRIREWLKRDRLSPRDLCILCRMKPAVYAEKLRDALEAVGVRSRIENEIQDLLAEPLVECLLDILKLACRDSAPESWARTIALLGECGGDHSDGALRQGVDRLLAYLPSLRAALNHDAGSSDDILRAVQQIMSFVGEAAYKAVQPQYLQGDWYSRVMDNLAKTLWEARVGREWSDAIDEAEGVDCVPIMTTHKSKGLEYHTVVFVGLEDGAHFAFARNQIEEMCGFFVALSRAKKRAVFTFSGVRPTGRNGSKVVQGRQAIKPLYDLLESAGVQFESVP